MAGPQGRALLVLLFGAALHDVARPQRMVRIEVAPDGVVAPPADHGDADQARRKGPSYLARGRAGGASPSPHNPTEPPGLGPPQKMAAEGAAAEEAGATVPEEEEEEEEGGTDQIAGVLGQAAAETEKEQEGENEESGENEEGGWVGRRRRRWITRRRDGRRQTPAPTAPPVVSPLAKPALLLAQKKWAAGAMAYFNTPVCQRRAEWREPDRWLDGCPDGWEKDATSLGGYCFEKCNIVPHIGTNCGFAFCAESTAGYGSHVAGIFLSSLDGLSSLMGFKGAISALKSAAKAGKDVFKRVLKQEGERSGESRSESGEIQYG